MTLAPSVSPDLIFPPKTAFMARTDLSQTRLLGYQALHQDSVTTMLAGLLNGHRTIRHRSGATSAVLQTYARAGLPVEEDVRTYDTGAEAEALAGQAIAEGYGLAYPYPLPEGRYPEAGLLMPSALWRSLNAKENLHRIVPPDHLMAREVLPLAKARDRRFALPVWLKAAGDQATGCGFAVRHCADEGAVATALADFAGLPGVTHVIAEADAGAGRSWCASIVVAEGGTIYAGAAEQEFTGPGHQAGSVIDPEAPLPEAGQRLAVQVGEAARALGFRGLAGLDIGLAADGRLIIFDPNFRFNSSTSQAMLHASASGRSGHPASRSFQVLSGVPFGELASRLASPIDAAWFIPTRLLDGSLLPAAEGKSIVTGFVLGESLKDATLRAQELTDRLAA